MNIATQKNESEHCAVLYERYRKWCAKAGCDPLPNSGFYARLVGFDAHKIRNGRNGPAH